MPVYSYYSYVKKANVAEMKNELSRYLAYVRRGGRVTIFNRDTPVAELVPARDSEAGTGDRLERAVRQLARDGVVRRSKGSVPKQLLEPLSGSPSGVLDALLEERATGR